MKSFTTKKSSKKIYQKIQIQIDELQTRLEFQQSYEREEELERLRVELVSATETARKLFGAALVEQSGEVGGDEKAKTIDPMFELRLRIVQLDRQLESAERQRARAKDTLSEVENALEQRDLTNARLNSENRRIREVKTQHFFDSFCIN